jgi:hypothetical protein
MIAPSATKPKAQDDSKLKDPPVREFLNKKSPKARKRGPFTKALAVGLSSTMISGCSGLNAWLHYNEGKVTGCFISPNDVDCKWEVLHYDWCQGSIVTPEESATGKTDCLTIQGGSVEQTP